MGCSRFVFNPFLAKWSDTYKEKGKGLTYKVCSLQLIQLKKEFVRFAKSREVEGRVLNATIRRNPTDKYFVSILAETEVQPFLSQCYC